MLPQDLIDKLLKIEALHAGATTLGEREAANNARQRILERLQQVQREDRTVEMKFSLPDPWSRMLFLALVRRYDLHPYRKYRQHHQTVMVKIPRRFLDETLWPQYLALSRELHAYLHDVTARIIAEAVHGDATEATEMQALPGDGQGDLF